MPRRADSFPAQRNLAADGVTVIPLRQRGTAPLIWAWKAAFSTVKCCIARRHVSALPCSVPFKRQWLRQPQSASMRGACSNLSGFGVVIALSTQNERSLHARRSLSRTHAGGGLNLEHGSHGRRRRVRSTT